MKTYHIGLLQAHAYRVLKKYTKRYLAEYEIDDIEWSILGLLYSQESTPGDIADKLGVEIPFVNKVSNALLEKGFMKKLWQRVGKSNRTKVTKPNATFNYSPITKSFTWLY